MDTNAYLVTADITYFDGSNTPADEYFSICGTLEAAKGYIAEQMNSRALWDDDGFTREVRFYVRYGKKHTNSFHPQAYYCTFTFVDAMRTFGIVEDGFIASSSI